MEHFDLIVVGAGAAGLMAAERAAAGGQRTLLLEKNRKAGVKILMSGGTRCNVTQDTDRRGIIEAFGKPGRFLHSSLAALPPEQVRELLADEGVATKVESTGKVFPVSNRAADVLAALLARLHRTSCQLALQEPVVEVHCESAPTRFRLRTAKRQLTARRLLLACGGQSYPGCGTTGDGYAWARRLGHTVLPPRPALVPLTTSSAWPATLQGITVPEASVGIRRAGGGTLLDSCRDSLLFTHFGFSGPAAMNVSRTVTGSPRSERLELVCNFLPDQAAESLDELLRSAGGKLRVAQGLPQELPKRLVGGLIEQAGVDPDCPLAEMRKSDRQRLIQALTQHAVPIAGTRGFKKAEVTAGGIPLGEVDSRTLESKCCPGLHLAGEILDLDGPIGGYNFQAAFSTGWLAGERIAACANEP